MEATSPRVSFVIPVYNGMNYLHEAIDSTLAQTFRDYEVLVVDDGSTDGTWDVIQSYGHLIRGLRQANGGTASALNYGIRQAAGKYVAWLSHDDRAVPNKLEVQLEKLALYPDAVGAYSDYFIIDDHGKLVGHHLVPGYEPDQMLRHFVQSMFINGSTVLVERERLLQLGLFDESLRYANDSLMWLRLLEHHSLVHVAQPLTEYRIHSGQGSVQKRRAVLRDHVRWLRIFMTECDVTHIFPELRWCSHDSRQRARAHMYLGDVLLKLHHQGVMARQQYIASIQADPRVSNPARLRWLYSFLRPTLSRLRRMMHGMVRVLVLKQSFRPADIPAAEFDHRTREIVPIPEIHC